MKQVGIKQLLERYWQCETSVEEERLLRKFFSGKNVPEELKIYQPLFTWQKKQRKPVLAYLYPVLKTAASVLIVMVLGISIYTYYQQEKFMDKMFSEIPVNPADSMQTGGGVVAKSSLQLTPENIAEDSLRQANPEWINWGE